MDNLKRQVEETSEELKRASQRALENPRHDDGDRDEDDRHGSQNVPLLEAQEEINRVQNHYENEIVTAKKERVELVSKVHELMSQNERIKLESNK